MQVLPNSTRIQDEGIAESIDRSSTNIHSVTMTKEVTMQNTLETTIVTTPVASPKRARKIKAANVPEKPATTGVNLPLHVSLEPGEKEQPLREFSFEVLGNEIGVRQYEEYITFNLLPFVASGKNELLDIFPAGRGFVNAISDMRVAGPNAIYEHGVHFPNGLPKPGWSSANKFKPDGYIGWWEVEPEMREFLSEKGIVEDEWCNERRNSWIAYHQKKNRWTVKFANDTFITWDEAMAHCKDNGWEKGDYEYENYIDLYYEKPYNTLQKHDGVELVLGLFARDHRVSISMRGWEKWQIEKISKKLDQLEGKIEVQKEDRRKAAENRRFQRKVDSVARAEARNADFESHEYAKGDLLIVMLSNGELLEVSTEWLVGKTIQIVHGNGSPIDPSTPYVPSVARLQKYREIAGNWGGILKVC